MSESKGNKVIWIPISFLPFDPNIDVMKGIHASGLTRDKTSSDTNQQSQIIRVITFLFSPKQES
jgi:hypothetical protein